MARKKKADGKQSTAHPFRPDRKHSTNLRTPETRTAHAYHRLARLARGAQRSVSDSQLLGNIRSTAQTIRTIPIMGGDQQCPHSVNTLYGRCH